MISNTSREAYKSIVNIGSKQWQVLEAIKDHGPIDNEGIARILGWPINRVTGRVNELCKKGAIKHDGYTTTSSQRRAKVWTIDEEGTK